MEYFFVLLFFIVVVTTIILLINPSIISRFLKASLTRLKIFIYGLLASLFCIVMIGFTAPDVDPKQLNVENFSDENVKVSEQNGKIIVSPVEKKEKSQADIDKEAVQLRQQFEGRKAELDEEDRPHFDWPRVDYTKTVAKVDLNNDKAILKAVGKPVVETEKIGDQNGEPATIYYFSKNITSGLDITLSRQFIDVSWQFNSKDPTKATAIFEDGQRITRALLGGKAGSELYEKMAKGMKFEEIQLDDGTIIKNARCGASICRYEVLR